MSKSKKLRIGRTYRNNPVQRNAYTPIGASIHARLHRIFPVQRTGYPRIFPSAFILHDKRAPT
ncbi:hypothetical protein DQQ10_24645 [Pseudochryseolinea flava]|uniref:Uncharacterized protein n=1 Tax=Pseudochryseolinea flava TaxID=2059302 RepID=A0A364XVN2_9BACT|nr:hypothetical protein DQQ10_24645 [Pseudochryseolinea flava]